eukprot:EG_transcript_25096
MGWPNSSCFQRFFDQHQSHVHGGTSGQGNSCHKFCVFCKQLVFQQFAQHFHKDGRFLVGKIWCETELNCLFSKSKFPKIVFQQYFSPAITSHSICLYPCLGWGKVPPRSEFNLWSPFVCIMLSVLNSFCRNVSWWGWEAPSSPFLYCPEANPQSDKEAGEEVDPQLEAEIAEKRRLLAELEKQVVE